MNLTTIINNIIGTLPLFALVVAYLLRVEHRLTKLETLIIKTNGAKALADSPR